eukprot:TRINITY_DN18600_c0_g2_i1.p1 TRINITY_DN18600_c0_g2~~TRINITY_DN18600_c0_g2_i1.p1  ORF type:complete len:375 (+),score=130.16 TRINITY_DN18600_c0_g2_i1:66-1127(+)
MRLAPALLAVGLHQPASAEVWQHKQGQIHPLDYKGGECLISTRVPASADLKFCHWYNSRTCCIPAADQESFDQFFALMDLGLSCSHARHSVKQKYRSIREWFCLACDPREPTYRFLSSEGSKDNNIPPDPNRMTAGTVRFRWRVCKSFVDRMWNGDGSPEELNGHVYDQCGVKIQNPCDGQKQVVWDPTANQGYGGVKETNYPVLNQWDPYMCGDSLIVPSKYFGGKKGVDAGTDFLRKILPPSFEDIPFEFVVVDDTVTDEQCAQCVVEQSSDGSPRCRASDKAPCPDGCVLRQADLNASDPSGQSGGTQRCRGFSHQLTPCFLGGEAAGAALGAAPWCWLLAAGALALGAG